MFCKSNHFWHVLNDNTLKNSAMMVIQIGVKSCEELKNQNQIFEPRLQMSK